MKKLIASALLGLCFQQGFSQNRLSGKFTDTSGQPVPYLEITASAKDTTLKGAVTDTSGVFTLNLAKGTYTLKASLFGKKVYERQLTVERALDLGVIRIETGMKLGEVAVSAQKKWIEQKVDRLVFHVENAIGASGGDALDALKITPRLRVENGDISMIGKGSLRVMVNGRILPLSRADLTNYLKTISTDNIKSIEVITTPPARYEAEGNSGLINIVLKKNKADYIGGSVFGSYRQQTYGDYALGTHINYQKDKLSLYTHVNRGQGAKHPIEEQTLYYQAFTLHNKSIRKDAIDYLGVQSALDYRWSDHFTTGLSYHISASKPDRLSDAQGRYVSKLSDEPDSAFTSKNRSSVKRTLQDIHAYTDWKLDTLGKKVSLDVGYLDQQNHSEGSLSSALFIQKRAERKDTISNTLGGAFKAKTLSTDVQLPYKKFKLSLGAKLSAVHAKNDFREYRHEKGQSTLNTRASNTFDYTENTQALYGDFAKDWDKLSLKLGLRLENTQTKGQSPTLRQTHRNAYSKLFPTLYISYRIRDRHSLGFTYDRRIGRPYYGWLNPFRVF